MIVIGSMDFYQGQVVRLTQGEQASITQVKADALTWLTTLQSHGMQRLHCVDLDGAFKTGNNTAIISSIIQRSSCPVQVGGGIHSMEAIDFWLSQGAAAVVLGSALFTQPKLLETALKQYGDKIIVALDVLDENIMIHGWQHKVDIDLFTMLAHLESLGVKTILMSDVARDGMLQGSNVALYRKIRQHTRMAIQASGGIRTRQDVLDLVPYSLMGVIVGKAFIHQTCDLAILGETL